MSAVPAQPSRARDQVPGGRDDRGESLIELLVALTVLGLGVSVILGAIMLSVDSSSLHRNQARAQALLRSWAEQVSAVTDTSYVPCASPAAYPAPPSATVPPGFVTQVTQVRYWDSATASFGTSCAAAADGGVQQVQLTVTAPTGLYPGFSQSLTVVVRRPCLPTTAVPLPC